MGLAPGPSIGHYNVGALLGEGGMGEVYRARDTKLERDVALKLLSPELAEDPERLARLHREARMLASLDHPNINAIYAVEEVAGTHFLVLQLVEGTTLAERLASGRMPLDAMIRTAALVAEALEAAHAQGLVHRDLKPSNIMISPDGRVKVLDFGIAKAIGHAESPALGTSVTRSELTRAGAVMGTPPYMSPEQLRGDSSSASADIWAFGCVLYEMLAGQPAFSGDTSADTTAAILTREPDWGALPDGLPEACRRLTQRCVRKDPGERLHAIADARIELYETLGELRGVPSSSRDGREPPGVSAPAVSDPGDDEPRPRTRVCGAWRA